jgi:hypothetical protein
MQWRTTAPTRAAGRALVAAVATVALAALAGCAAYSPKGLRVGDSEAAIAAAMGAPSARYPMTDGGTRLVYARGPMGRHTYMLDLTPAGGLRQWTQVLTELHFAEIEPGWTMDRVRFEFGPPAEARPNRPNRGQLWSYRYPTHECLWFQLTFDPSGVVDSTGYGIDWSCDPGDSQRN